MTLEFLVLANLCLFTRLACLFRNDAASGRLWLAKTLVELLGLAAFYTFSGVWFAAGVSLLALNLIGYVLERRSRRKDFARLLFGAASLALLSVWFSQRMGLGFRPELTSWTLRLREWTVLEPMLHGAGTVRFHLVLFGLLISANEANLAIRAVFDWLDLKPRTVPQGSDVVDVGEFNRGRVIGMLERILLFSFVLQGQYGAIGFILAAKAFTRFKALDDRPFAEYVLIGTLLSASLALATGGLVRALLALP